MTCHYDVLDWLEPDWVYQPHTDDFARGSLWRRPKIELEVKRVHHSAWQLFRKHHYLDTKLNTSAACFIAFWNGIPVAFTAILHFPHAKVKNIKREHRTVCLPDFQGVGIGNALSNYLGAMCRGLGFRYLSQTSHPSMIKSRAESENWRINQAPTYRRALCGARSAHRNWFDNLRTRLIASCEYVGGALDHDLAKSLWRGA